LGPQTDLQLAHLFYIFPILGSYETHDFSVILYRPGYDTMMVAAWPLWFPLGYCFSQSVQWEKCPDVRAQEKALNRLLSKSEEKNLDPKTLRFAAAEYERLARCAGAPGTNEVSTQWHLMARHYEELAVEREKRAAEKTE
jgi:hypothetical protein